ncbi:MAG: hypothetical protein AAF821_09255 [Cyanobacteria bacterium P01_D01_bin.156]
MSPAMLIFLPLTLLLLMSKGAGAKATTPKQTDSEKVMGVLTKEGEFIPLPSINAYRELDTDEQGVVIEQNGQRYLLASID